MRSWITLLAAAALLAGAAGGCNQFGGAKPPADQPFLDDEPSDHGGSQKGHVAKLMAEAGFGSGDMRQLEAYRDALAAAKSTGDKWTLTRAYLQTVLSQGNRHGVPLAQEIKADVCAGGPMAEIWAEHYPEIAHTVRWEPEHLQYVSERLGSQAKMYWNLRLSGHQISAAWLKILTGLDFVSRPQFDQWYAKYARTIRWHRPTGRFALVEQTGPRPTPARPTPTKPAKPAATPKPSSPPTTRPTTKPAASPTGPAVRRPPARRTP